MVRATERERDGRMIIFYCCIAEGRRAYIALRILLTRQRAHKEKERRESGRRFVFVSAGAHSTNKQPHQRDRDTLSSISARESYTQLICIVEKVNNSEAERWYMPVLMRVVVNFQNTQRWRRILSFLLWSARFMNMAPFC